MPKPGNTDRHNPKPTAQVQRQPPQSPTSPQGQYSLTTVSYEGILPPPNMLRGYDEVLPGAAERILTMAETQAKHRQSLETRVVDGNVKAQTRGQYFGLAVALVFCVAGAFLAYSGRDVAGLGTIISALSALVTVFVVGKKQQEAERGQKRTENQPTAKAGG